MSTPASIEAELGWALGTVTRNYLRTAGEALTDVPGGPKGYLVLASLGTGEPSTQVALAQHLGVDRTMMTYLLDDLEEAGLVEGRPDPADRRPPRGAPPRPGGPPRPAGDAHRRRHGPAGGADVRAAQRRGRAAGAPGARRAHPA